MKVSELEGAALDYWVAHADGVPRDVLNVKPNLFLDEYRPATDWRDGGPIIERERICVYPAGSGRTTWDAYYQPIWGYDGPEADHTADDAPTALIAAMRCYVASKFGETVPDDITAPPHASPPPRTR